jgi:hypothetical protein
MKNRKIKLYQLNVRSLDAELKFLQNLQKSNDVTIGFEITNDLISQYLDINIDPQHNFDQNTKTTCVEELINLLPKLYEQTKNRRIWLFFLKTDLDSIAAATILYLYFSKSINIENPVISERIFNIANYDRHGRKWEPKLFDNKVDLDKESELCECIKFKIPRGLFMLISGWKNTLDHKISTMRDWILTGTFKEIDFYNQMATENFKEALSSSKIEIISPDKLVFVRSNKRGACGIGYQFAPVVIAMNPSFRFGFGDSRVYGRKWAIAQCDSGFIPMSEILNSVLELEPGWGGSETIIGSPQLTPSRISKDDIVEITSDVVKKYFK